MEVQEIRMKYSSPLVGKVYRKIAPAEEIDADVERAMGLRVLEMDPLQHHSCAGLQLCEMSKEYAEAAKKVCGYAFIDRRQLILTFAGVTLADVARNIHHAAGVVDIMTSMCPLMNWLAVANSNGIHHFDLKESNIMYLEQRLRIIDWGMATRRHAIFQKHAPAAYFPPDFHTARRLLKHGVCDISAPCSGKVRSARRGAQCSFFSARDGIAFV
jgi:hypothetical protein